MESREDLCQPAIIEDDDSTSLIIPEDKLEAWKREAQLVALGVYGLIV
jgi:hypothetical protein